MRRNRSVFITATLFAASTIGLSAQSPSEARIQELLQQAAAAVATGSANGQAPAPNVTQSSTDTRPVIHLSLDDAVKFTLDQNLDIAVQRLNPQISDVWYASLRSVYHPSLTSQIAAQSQTNPSTTTISGGVVGQPIVTGLNTYNAGVAQSVPYGGGNFTVALNNNRQTTTSLNTLFNPTLNTNWSGTYTQPLLRGFKIDSTRQQLRVSKISRDITETQLKATITNTLSNVRNAYWDYVFATQSVEVAQQSVTLAERLVQDNTTRVEVGTMAPIDVVQAQAQAALQRQNLVTAQATKRTGELALKRLLVSGTQDPLWSSSIDATDRPDFEPQQIDVEAAVRRALSERTDLAIAHKNLESNNVTIKFLSDQLLPQADMQATYGLVGLGGDQLIKTGSGVNQVATGSIPGGYSNALSSMLRTAAFPRWTMTFNLSYPIGLSSAKATVARAHIQLNQDEAQLKQIELQVATDVTNAATNVQSNGERVQAAQAARELAQKQLDAETSKFEVGMSTNYNVVQSQRDLATAQNNELSAILSYRKSLVELERLQQTTLSNLNVTVVSNATR